MNSSDTLDVMSLSDPSSFRPWTLWLRWVIAGSFSWLIGITLASMIIYFVSLFSGGSWINALWWVGGLLIGTGFGINQLIALRSIRHYFEDGVLSRWFVATLLGWSCAIGFTSGTDYFASTDVMVTGLFIGLIVGLPQWYVIRSTFRMAWVWIAGSGAAWLAGMSIIHLATQQITYPFVGLVSSILTGLILLLLIRSRHQSVQS